MMSYVSKLLPTDTVLAVARERGSLLWSTLLTLPRRVFQRFRGSLRVKFIVGIVSLQLAMMGGVVVIMEGHQRAGILEQARLRALSLARSLAALSEGDLLSYNFVKLEQIAEAMTADDRDILYAVAHLHDGSVAVFSGRDDLQGTQLEDPVSRHALQAIAPLVQELRGSDTSAQGYDVAVPVFVSHSAKKWGTIRLGFSLQQAYERIYHIRRALIWLGLGAIVCGTSLAVGLALWVSRPIAQLVTGVQAFASGSSDQPLRMHRRDELGYLAHAFDQMRAALQHHLASLAEEKHRLEETNRRLQQTQQQLIQAERLATVGRMAAWVAHEINNPLTIILTAIRLIKNRRGENNPDAEHLQVIDAEVSRIARILREPLDFSLPNPTQEAVDINAIIHSLEPLLAPTLQGKQVALSVLLEPGLPRVRMASDRLKQVLLNIIRNAEEAMPGGGRLVVQTTRQPGSVQVRITDTGGGILAEHLEQVFDPFFTTKGLQGGMGVGLAISYRLVKSANGRIDIESELGKGSTFRVSLPACEP